MEKKGSAGEFIPIAYVQYQHNEEAKGSREEGVGVRGEGSISGGCKWEGRRYGMG